MGIRESLLNTITSVADSDFVRIVTSAGASSKATVRNLFKGFESNLSAKSSLTTSDYIRVVGSDNEAYKQSISSMKTAMGIDTLDNRTKAYSYTQATGSFLDWVQATFTSNGNYYVVMESTNHEGWPSESIGTCLVQKRNGFIFLLAFVNESSIANYQSIWLNRYTGSAWVGWSRTPRMAEVDNKIKSAPTGTAGKLTDLLLSRDSQGPYISVWSTDDTSQRIGYFRLASSKVNATFNAPTGTSNGDLQYARTGNTIAFAGSMYVSATVANSTVLFSGLPVPHGALAGFRCTCSTTGTWFDCYINSDGTLRAVGNWTAIGWYRFAGAYVD